MPASGNPTFNSRAIGTTGALASGPPGPAGTPSRLGLSIAHRPRSEMGAGDHSSSDHTQCFGEKENRTGSLCPMNGGGPVLANACTMLPAMTTRKTIPASPPERPERPRPVLDVLLPRQQSAAAPIVATQTQ